jgi:CBS domain-containing protein
MEQLLPFPTAAEMIAKKREPLVSVAPGATVLAALQLMAERHIGFLVVMENGRLVGVLSERDCARRVVLGKLVAADTAVRDVMTTGVHTVTPESRIPDCIALMHEKGIRHLPVVRGKEIVGVVSVHDLMGAALERNERLLRQLAEERLTLLYPDPSSY